MTELSPAQLQAWDTALHIGTTTHDDPRAGAARLRGRLRNVIACLREAAESARRLGGVVAALRAEVRIERDRLSSLVARVPVPYLLTSPDGTILEVNAAACATLGVSARALLGRDVLIFFDDRDAWRQLLAQTAASRVGSQRPGRLRPRERLQVRVTADLSHVNTLGADAIQWVLTGLPQPLPAEAGRVLQSPRTVDA